MLADIIDYLWVTVSGPYLVQLQLELLPSPSEHPQLRVKFKGPRSKDALIFVVFNKMNPAVTKQYGS